MGAALSGYNGANTGLNIYTLAPDPGASISDIGFTDTSGAALNGQDSLVQTLNGDHVFLYTDSANNNIVLGREGTGSTPNPTGTIVFAAYIDESATGGKVWTVHYQQIKHSGGSDSDVSVSLSGALSIAAAQDLSFTLANAPSGQNLFLMFTTANPTIETVGGIARIAGPSIIATGKDPANQSTGVNITTGDTINTSQAGGPTTFGTNNQMITEQEGIRFTFVTGARQDVTIPNLDQTEAKVESNIDFTGMFNARSATFDVVQLQSGKSAQVKISAFNTAAEPGTVFVDGYAGDASVAISNVVVRNATGTVIENSDGSINDPSINITFSSGVATVTGIMAGYNISYTTNGDHNRVLVENAAAVNAKGNDHADFDIGGFKLLQVTKEALSIGSQVSIEDDGPLIAEGVPPSLDKFLQVDETDLAANASANFSTELAPASITPGTDGTGSTSSVYSLGISLTGADSGLVDTATNHSVFLFLNSGVVEGREGTDAVAAASGAIVFTVSVNSGTGVVTLDQQRAIVHPDTANPDDVKALSAADLIVLSRADTVTDGDGNTASSSTSTNIGLAFEFKDDGPSITVTNTAPADALTVDETNLLTNASANFADSNDLVFTVAVDGSGTVTLDQIRALKHPVNPDPNDPVSPSAADLIALTRTDIITDKDGDTNTSAASLNIAAALSFLDDGPTVFSPASVTLTNNGTGVTTGDLDTTSAASPWLSARVGADKPGSVTFVDNNLADNYLHSTAIGTPILKSGGENIVLSGYGTGTLLAQTETTHLTVFTATLDPAGGQYTIDFDKTIDDGSGVTILGAAPVKSGNPNYNLINNVGGTALDILFSGTVPGTSSVNVSTQGAGVGNQTMNPGETLRLDLVTGGALAGSPEGSDFNYTAHQTVNGFSFLVSQNSPGGTEGTVYLKAYDADNDKVLSGDAGDAVDPISKVMVNGQLLVDGATLHTLTINGHTVTPILSNGGVVITGLNEGATGDGAGGDDPVVKVYTADGFNRVELTNYSGQTVNGNLLSGGDFDIAPAGIEQGVAGNPVDFSLPVHITDQDGDTTPIELIGVHLDPMPLV
ncbi:MAG: hypothetical protein EBU46_10250 [Nitrosomonadaceae bacterium]|nr:hypothetical protein [Nitrosomonadaceae bacterium]